MLAKRRNADGNVQGCLFVARMVPFEIQCHDTLIRGNFQFKYWPINGSGRDRSLFVVKSFECVIEECAY